MQLIIKNNSATNPLTLDLSQYVDVQQGDGMDPANSEFTTKIWGRSLLKQGATLALEQLQEKQLMFPLVLGPVGGLSNAPQNTSALMLLIEQINQIINSAGFTASWQPDGASQATVWDGLSGQLDVDYDFRTEQQHWTRAKLRLFLQPLGHPGGPRPYAAASGVGPLLVVAPYASGGALSIGASTQAGVAGFGGAPRGASTGIFYSGAPSLAGDAPAQLQIGYTVGPSTATPSITAVSLLPDGVYNPQQNLSPQAGNTYGASVPGGTVFTAGAGAYSQFVSFQPTRVPNSGPGALAFPPDSWAGNHRMLAMARSSGTTQVLIPQVSSLISTSTVASVGPPGVWGIYDVGCFALRASQVPGEAVAIGASVQGGGSGAVDICAVFTFPDNSTWFINGGTSAGPLGNNVLIDDVVGEQFYTTLHSVGAASPATLANGIVGAIRQTQYSRGLVPSPDPKTGFPTIAILGNIPSTFPSWQMSAQVSILEKTRYILP